MNKLLSTENSKDIFQTQDTVLVTGSFDYLHLGHIKFFEQIKDKVSTTHKLVVIVLGDKQISSRKGLSRPIFTLEDRILMLQHIDLVDYILGWEQDWTLLRDFVLENKPNYLAVVKGDSGLENKRQHIEQAGGEILVIERDPRYSSSSIIEKLGLE